MVFKVTDSLSVDLTFRFVPLKLRGAVASAPTSA